MSRHSNCFLVLGAALLAFASLYQSADAAALMTADPVIPILAPVPAPPNAVIAISVKNQKLAVIMDGKKVATYPVSTSKFGVGDTFGSYKTPAGVMMVCNKLGGTLPAGAVIKHRYATGEVLAPDAPGRDPIVTRIICLRGLEAQNRNALPRSIYIHGTPQEKTIGTQASYGCIRMRSKDVIALYNVINIGACVEISEEKLSKLLKTPVVMPVEGMHNLMAAAMN